MATCWRETLRGVYPALAGILVLLTGVGLTWIVATNSYTKICRLDVETDFYSCWSLMAIPLLVGVGSTALGGVALVRGLLSLPWPKQFTAFNSWKTLFAFGFLPLAAVCILALELYTSSAVIHRSYLGTLLFLLFMGILIFIGVEWVLTFLRPSRENNSDSRANMEGPA